GADEVAGDEVVRTLDLDPVAAETVDRQALNGAPVAAGPEGQSVGCRAGAGAVQFEEDHGVVPLGQRVRGGLPLRVPVDEHRLEDRGQGAADDDRLHAGAGEVEVDGVVGAECTGVLGGDVRVAQVVPSIDGGDGLAERDASIIGRDVVGDTV